MLAQKSDGGPARRGTWSCSIWRYEWLNRRTSCCRQRNLRWKDGGRGWKRYDRRRRNKRKHRWNRKKSQYWCCGCIATCQNYSYSRCRWGFRCRSHCKDIEKMGWRRWNNKIIRRNRLNNKRRPDRWRSERWNASSQWGLRRSKRRSSTYRETLSKEGGGRHTCRSSSWRWALPRSGSQHRQSNLTLYNTQSSANILRSGEQWHISSTKSMRTPLGCK